jgi:hypothetical protein
MKAFRDHRGNAEVMIDPRAERARNPHYRSSFGCPMMNDTMLKQIAAVKATVNKGNHIWI